MGSSWQMPYIYLNQTYYSPYHSQIMKCLCQKFQLSALKVPSEVYECLFMNLLLISVFLQYVLRAVYVFSANIIYIIIYTKAKAIANPSKSYNAMWD